MDIISYTLCAMFNLMNLFVVKKKHACKPPLLVFSLINFNTF
jgi:hypothetical protein